MTWTSVSLAIGNGGPCRQDGTTDQKGWNGVVAGSCRWIQGHGLDLRARPSNLKSITVVLWNTEIHGGLLDFGAKKGPCRLLASRVVLTLRCPFLVSLHG